MIPTFHASSHATLEVAIAPSNLAHGDSPSISIEDDARQLEEEASLQADENPVNASDVESQGTVNGWSISDTQSTEGSVFWEPCRYYEVGNIREGVQQVISNATLGENLGLTSCE